MAIAPEAEPETKRPEIVASGGTWLLDAEDRPAVYLRITAFDDEQVILSFEGTVTASLHCSASAAREFALEIIGATRKGGGS